MALPVDTTKLMLLCGAPPEAMLDQSGEHRKNRAGEELYRTEVVVMGFGRPQLCSIRTAKEPKGLVVGSAVVAPGFSVSSFQAKEGGTGILYEAQSVEPAKAQREPAS